MARGQGHAGRGQQVNERIGAGRHGLMNGIQHLFVLVRASDGKDLGVVFADVVGFSTQASGDDDLAVFRQRLADGIKAFGLGGIQKAACVDDDGVRAGIVGRDRVSFGAQAREDAFAVHQGLGAAEGHHADGRLAHATAVGRFDFGCEIRAE